MISISRKTYGAAKQWHTLRTREGNPMRGIWGPSLGLLLACLAAGAEAQEPAWRPSLGRPVAIEAPSTPSPVVTLGQPIPLAQDIQPASYQPAESSPTPRVARAQIPDGGPFLSVPAQAGPASPIEQYNCGMANDNPAAPPSHPFWDKCRDICGGFPWIGKNGFDSNGHHLFESDRCFREFISPVSNPFLFEDPRSLTEVRPLFIYQATPAHNYIFHGGDIEFFGVQARVAVTDWFSVVMSKLGGIWAEPHVATEGFQPHSGFSEINIGPKFTFLRSESTGTIGAAGLNFIIPSGPHKVFQDTGSLTLEPYVSLGQRFGHTTWGTFDALGTLGYNASVDSQRSENIFLSLHLDFDYADLHKIYPLIELNWFHYTSSGKANNLDFEGRDLFNFGSQHVAGNDDVSMAFGARYKQNDNLSFGAAVEVPISGRKDLMDFRLLFDVIFRY
jgi:hypothetical protein